MRLACTNPRQSNTLLHLPLTRNISRIASGHRAISCVILTCCLSRMPSRVPMPICFQCMWLWPLKAKNPTTTTPTTPTTTATLCGHQRPQWGLHSTTTTTHPSTHMAEEDLLFTLLEQCQYEEREQSYCPPPQPGQHDPPNWEEPT